MAAFAQMVTSIFSYVITADTGFAPNPYGGFLTLATCKPRIRSTAGAGDWILGTGSKRLMDTDRVVYVGLVSEVVSLEVYGDGPRFAAKRPRMSGEPWRRHGDSIYFKTEDGRWLQRRNPHHDSEAMTRDIGGRNALICQRFWYFGALAPTLPAELHTLIKSGPGHKRTRDSGVLVRLQRWLESWPQGIVPGDAVRSEVPSTVANAGGPAQASAACRMRQPVRC